MSMRQIKITKSITNRESQSLEKSLQEISRVERITSQEEVTLAEKIKNGDQYALDQLTRANLRFVVSVAKQYQNQGLTLSDLINEGNVGLIKPAQRFDETKGFKFISYAVWWIRQSILQALAEQSRIVKLPLNKVGLKSRISKAFQTLEQQLEREPAADELADFLDISYAEVAASLQANVHHISMDMPIRDGEDNTLMDTIVNENAGKADERLSYYESLRTDLSHTLKSLTDKQRSILCYFYGIGVDHPLTLEDIGEKFKLSRERVRQIKDKAIMKLQNTKGSRRLKVYLG